MHLSRRSLLAAAAAATLQPPRRARAQAPKLKLGVLTDMSGPYSDAGGPVCVRAAELAVADFGAAAKGLDVEIVSADHQNKADIGAGIARQWFDVDGVDVILDVNNSVVALAVAGVAHDKNKVFLDAGAATSDLTGAHCNANTIHWVYDTYMLAKSTGSALVKAGGDSWFFIAADYTFGQVLQRDTTRFIESEGGKVLGSVRYPFPGTTDFSAFLAPARASGAKVIGVAAAGADAINIVKQAREFGITQTLAGLILFVTDIHGMGLEVSRGLVLTEAFYWDLNDSTSAFSNRLRQRVPDRRPTSIQAGVYSAALHYLKVAHEMGAARAKQDGAATVAALKAMPTDDDCFGPGSIRSDGRRLTPAYLFRVKSPSDSKYPWDYYSLLATTPADEAFRPLADGHCPLVKS